MGLRDLLVWYSRHQVKVNLYVVAIFIVAIGIMTGLSAWAVRSDGGIGSSGTRFDGTNEKTAEASLTQMAIELPDRAQTDKLKAALVILFEKQAAIDGTAQAEADEVDLQRVSHNCRQELHGLTASQIIKKANASPEEEAKALAQIRLQDAHLDRLITLNKRHLDALKESTDLMLTDAPIAKVQAARLTAETILHEIELENLEYKRDAAALK
jgi:hypothetical protein